MAIVTKKREKVTVPATIEEAYISDHGSVYFGANGTLDGKHYTSFLSLNEDEESAINDADDNAQSKGARSWVRLACEMSRITGKELDAGDVYDYAIENDGVLTALFENEPCSIDVVEIPVAERNDKGFAYDYFIKFVSEVGKVKSADAKVLKKLNRPK